MLPYLRNTIVQKKKNKAKGKPFNPNFDGNLLAWYDGDTLATDPANTWSDRSTNNYDLTLINNPTLQAGAINGHDALRFDGSNQCGQRLLTPVLNLPITFYIVFKQITWTLFDFVFCSSLNNNRLLQDALTPDLKIGNGAQLTANPQVALNTYEIFTVVYNGLNSEIRTNNNLAVIGNAQSNNTTGLTLASIDTLNVFYGNCEISYLIIRDVADNTATQNIIINALKARFAL